jgi:isopenicillin N synthase-like dioxygenase
MKHAPAPAVIPAVPTTPTTPTDGRRPVPVIDFAPFAKDAAGRAEVAAAIREACEYVGFFYLQVEAGAHIATILDLSRRFFDSPLAAREQADLRARPDSPRGYVPFNTRRLPNTGAPNLQEAFKLGPELALDDPDLLAGQRMCFVNKWPLDLPGWRSAILAYYDAMSALSGQLLRAFALSLDLPEDWFAAYFSKPLSQLSLIHYPPQDPDAPRDEYGIHPHTDQTMFSILAQDDVGGLEVRAADGGWLQVPSRPGLFVVNIGNLMARWTNDRYASTEHRVFNRSGRERYSAPFFYRPDFDTVITCLPTCQDAARPARHEPFDFGASISMRVRSDWVGSAPDKGAAQDY